MPTKQQIRRDQIILALVENLEHKEISEKSKMFNDLRAKCGEIRRFLRNPGIASRYSRGGWPDLFDAIRSGDIDSIRDEIRDIAESLGNEIKVLRAVHEARSNNKPINKTKLTENLGYLNTLERYAIENLKKLFGPDDIKSIKVYPQGEKLKPVIMSLLNAYEAISKKSFKKTLALLNNLS